MSVSKQLSSLTAKKTDLPSTEIRIVLLGKMGSGKSSTANSILGRKVFDSKASSSFMMHRSCRASGEVQGRHLLLLDTPGLLDTHQTPQDVHKELRKSVSLLYPGPHVFLLVIHIGRFTQEEKEAVRLFKKSMGSQALRFVVVVFTHGDLLQEGTFVRQSLMDRCEDLAKLVDDCGGRYCVFNNHSSKNKEQMSELLALMDQMMQDNKGSYYTSKILQKMEEELDLQLREEDQEQRHVAAVNEWYEKQLEVALGEMEKLKQKHEMEKQNQAKLARQREEAFRREMEVYYKREKERKTQEVMRVRQIRREELQKREVIQEKLAKVTKMMEEQVKVEEKMRREIERMERDSVENLMKEKEKELQQMRKEQSIRQGEEMKREALQEEVEKLTLSLKELSGKEEEEKREMEALLKHEREDNQRAWDTQMENLRTVEESLKRQLEEDLRNERVKCLEEILMFKKQRDRKHPATWDKTAEMRSPKTLEVVPTVTGYAQEMGLLAVNVALEKVGTPCCIQ